MSKLEVDQIDPQSGTTLTIGTSGDTIVIPSGVNLAAGAVLTAPVLEGTSSTAGSILFKEDTDNGTNSVTLKGPAATNDVTVTLPAATDTLVGKATTDTLTNKTINGSQLINATIPLNKLAAGTDGNIISYDNSGAVVAVATGNDGQVLTSAGAGQPPAFEAIPAVADNAITLAKMASGTDGNIISYDTSGNPVAVATGSSGQVLTSAGAGAVPTFADAGGGAYNLLSTTTISSAVASVDITSNINSTYKNYMFIATDIHISNDDLPILMRVFSADGSPDTSTNNFHFAGIGRTSDGSTLTKGSGGGNNQAEVNILELGNAAAEASNFVMYMYNPSGTTYHKAFYTSSQLVNSAGALAVGTMSQLYRKTIAITGVRFFVSSGTIETGVIKLYGIS